MYVENPRNGDETEKATGKEQRTNERTAEMATMKMLEAHNISRWIPYPSIYRCCNISQSSIKRAVRSLIQTDKFLINGAFFLCSDCWWCGCCSCCCCSITTNHSPPHYLRKFAHSNKLLHSSDSLESSTSSSSSFHRSIRLYVLCSSFFFAFSTLLQPFRLIFCAKNSNSWKLLTIKNHRFSHSNFEQFFLSLYLFGARFFTLPAIIFQVVYYAFKVLFASLALWFRG